MKNARVAKPSMIAPPKVCHTKKPATMPKTKNMPPKAMR